MNRHTPRTLLLTLLSLLMVAVSSPHSGVASAQEKDKNGLPPGKAAALAQDVVERLYKAFNDRDLDGMIVLVQVPFCLDGREILKDTGKLRKSWEKSLARQKPGVKLKFHIRKVAPMLDFIEEKMAPPSRGADMSAVLTRNHRVVLVEIERPGPPGGFERTWIGVNFENGKARIVGIAG
ncbi:MAG: hypothetical protein L0Z62_36340 [Gemmataceae bacterium]|nr:hypothetical protein [Gemmataceae bacterium]